MPSGPLTHRGRRTQAALLEAANKVFSESGFIDGSVVAIAHMAGVSNATFYTYYRSKEEIFLEVAAGLLRDIAHSTEDLDQPLALPVGIAKANAYFFDSYARHGRMLRVVAEAANHSEAIRVAWRDIRRVTIDAAARTYAALQAGGHVDRTLSPDLLAGVLGGATEQAAYLATFLDPEVDRIELERTLNHVWFSTLTTAVADPGPRRRRKTAARRS
jgi:AcrR family transcriptional regulator